MLSKTSKWHKTEILNTDEDYHTENHQNSQYVDILDFTCYLRYYGQNDTAETCFNVPLYLILLIYNAKMRINSICTTSRLRLMWYYLKIIVFLMLHFTVGWLCLTTNNLQSIKAREIMFAALERVLKYLIRNYNLKVTKAKYNLWKWTIWVKIFISKGYIRKCNMCNPLPVKIFNSKGYIRICNMRNPMWGQKEVSNITFYS